MNEPRVQATTAKIGILIRKSQMQRDSGPIREDGPIDGPRHITGPSDILSPGLMVVFCGLNPALSAAEDGHNFSNRSNRFWRVLHLAGFTPRQLRADEEWEMLQYGLGLTAAVPRPTKSASELKRHDYAAALPALERKIRSFAPVNLAFLGKAAYAALRPKAHIDWGNQPDNFAGAATWVLPNPSGLNRAFNLESLTSQYRELQAKCSAMEIACPTLI